MKRESVVFAKISVEALKGLDILFADEGKYYAYFVSLCATAVTPVSVPASLSVREYK